MGEVSARLGQARYAHYGSARLGQTAADEVLVECHRQAQCAQRHGRLPQVGQLKSNLEPTPRTTAPRSDHSPHAHRAVTGRVAAAPLAHQLHRPRVLPQRTAVAAATAAAAAELGELPTRPALLRAHRARADRAAGRTPRNLRGGDCAGECRSWLSDEGCRRVLLRLQAGAAAVAGLEGDIAEMCEAIRRAVKELSATQINLRVGKRQGVREAGVRSVALASEAIVSGAMVSGGMGSGAMVSGAVVSGA